MNAKLNLPVMQRKLRQKCLFLSCRKKRMPTRGVGLPRTEKIMKARESFSSKASSLCRRTSDSLKIDKCIDVLELFRF